VLAGQRLGERRLELPEVIRPGVRLEGGRALVLLEEPENGFVLDVDRRPVVDRSLPRRETNPF